MNKTVFNQLDTRWSGLPYPNRTYTIGNSGCGCVSVTHLLIETDEYSKYTPKDVQPYMKQFATYGDGTTWAGLTNSLKHYGFNVRVPAKMSDAFNFLGKAKYKMGLLSMRGGSKGGITFTTIGHIMSFVDYKVVNGKHYLYLKDSGGRKNTGWFCYETQMKGLVANIWIATPKADLFTPVGYYTIKFAKRGGEGEMKPLKVKVGAKVALPVNKFKRDGFKFVGWSASKASKEKTLMDHFQLGKVDYKNKAKIKDLAKAGKTITLYPCWKGYGAQAACLWARKIAKDNKFMYGEGSGNWYHGRDRAHQVGCHFCGTTVSGPKKAKKGSKWDFTYCCNSFVFAAFCHGANMYSKCKGGSTSPDFWLKLRKSGKRVFKKIGKNVKYSDLKPGDILMNGKHIMLFVGEVKGNLCVCHAAGEGWTDRSIRTQKVSGKTGDYTALRYVGR